MSYHSKVRTMCLAISKYDNEKVMSVIFSEEKVA